eukprot:2619058-Amphidinium_carterae.1
MLFMTVPCQRRRLSTIVMRRLSMSDKYLPASGLLVMWVMGLLDTGAQSTVIGQPAVAQWQRALEEKGLCPLEVQLATKSTRGIGEAATVLGSYQVPVGVCGVSGILTVQVLDQPIPLLLHVGFLKGLGMLLGLAHIKKWTPPNMHFVVEAVAPFGAQP